MSRYDVKCPYCKAEQEINHDDGYGYEEDETHEQECSKCEMTFVFTTSISFYHEAEQAPCKNGGEHDWGQIHGSPEEFYIGQFRCSVCDEEESREPIKRQKAVDKYMEELKKENLFKNTGKKLND